MRLATILLATPLALGLAQPAAASPRGAFDVAAETDTSLAGMTGGAIRSPLVSNARLMLDGNARTILRESAENAQVSMETWWAETGSVMIATNILASRLRP